MASDSLRLTYDSIAVSFAFAAKREPLPGADFPDPDHD